MQAYIFNPSVKSFNRVFYFKGPHTFLEVNDFVVVSDFPTLQMNLLGLIIGPLWEDAEGQLRDTGDK